MKPTRILLVFCTLCLIATASASMFGQASIRDLKASHAAALQTYLAKNKQNTFRPEGILDAEYLKVMRETFGKNFKPNYAFADLNKDGITDFAVLLNRAGKPTNLPPEETASKEHFPDYPLTLLVFNGVRKGGFRVAFRPVIGPKAAFINVTTARKKRVYYGVFETDSDTFTLVPTRTGYTMK